MGLLGYVRPRLGLAARLPKALFIGARKAYRQVTWLGTHPVPTPIQGSVELLGVNVGLKTAHGSQHGTHYLVDKRFVDG